MTAFLHHFGDGLCLASAGVLVITARDVIRLNYPVMTLGGVALYLATLGGAAALIALVLK